MNNEYTLIFRKIDTLQRHIIEIERTTQANLDRIKALENTLQGFFEREGID